MKQYSFLEEVAIRINNDTVAKAKKVGTPLLTGGLSAKAASISFVNGLVSKKIFQMRQQISKCETREQAANILINCGYSPDDVIGKKVKIASINYVLSQAVAGPAIQIVKNENDPNWKVNVLKYLKLIAVVNAGKAVAAGIGSIVLGVKTAQGIKGMRK